MEIKVNKPMATAPILLEIYTLKLTETVRMTKETTVIKSPFKINLLNLFIARVLLFFLLGNYMFFS